MNLFWQTRQLTQAREDHLTYFLAATLEADDVFRNAYQHRILSSLSRSSESPQIVEIQTQAVFPTERCRPDLLLRLADGRKVICEHKLEAPETPFELDTGEIQLQLERYLALPIDAVAYFRPALATLPSKITKHERWLSPASFPHFLWRDLYDPLSQGRHVLTSWLFEGFRRLGFTPAVPHVGPLWPDESDEVKENQRNFAKLWRRTRSHATVHWRVESSRRCELVLRPNSSSVVTRVYISPLAQGGSLLRFRLETTDGQFAALQERLAQAACDPPVVAEVVPGRLPNGLPFVDLLAPLYLVLGTASSPDDQEERLLRQVAPALDALLFDDADSIRQQNQAWGQH